MARQFVAEIEKKKLNISYNNTNEILANMKSNQLS